MEANVSDRKIEDVSEVVSIEDPALKFVCDSCA